MVTSNQLVSIIVPVYNVEKYCEKCILSLIHQTYSNIEILIIYSNSNDDSRNICENYAITDSRIKIFEERVQGLGAARDKGITVASGEWICFVDSDDYVHPQYVELLLNAVLEENCFIAKCRFKKVYSSEEIFEQPDPKVTIMDWKSFFLFNWENNQDGYNPFNVWCSIYHKSFFKKVSFKALRFAEDSYFTPKIIYENRNNNIPVLSATLYYYYQREDSLIHTQGSLLLLDRYKAKKAIMKLWEDNNEAIMYRLFIRDFVHCMINDFISLSCNMPKEIEKYYFLLEEIKRYLPIAKQYDASDLLIHPSSKENWEYILSKNGKIIIYAYGYYGKQVEKWLNYFDVNIAEIWDSNANIIKSSNLNVCLPHENAEKETLFLISTLNVFTGFEIQKNLEELGYKNCMLPDVLDHSIRYAKYQKFLPFLITESQNLCV